MIDIARYSLDWLTRQIRRTRVNIARAEEKYGNTGGCAGCVELADLELKVQMLEWLHALALREVGENE